MRNGQQIPYVESCKHLGNEISTVIKKLLIQNAKCDLNCRMNSLLADFSYCNSDTISMLFKSYCMNIYGSQIWKFYNKEVNIFFILHGKKQFAKYINYHIEHTIF